MLFERIRRARLALIVVSGGALLLSASPARADDAVQKPVTTLVKSVRYAKDANALKQMDGEAEGRILLGDDWEKGTPEQRAEFVSLFHGLFAALAFPKLKENLEYLGTTVYEKPAVTGDKATVIGTLAIDHPLKKQELRVQFDMHKTREGWKVVDVTVLGVGGNSMLTDIRHDQIIPIMAQGGWPHLLELMRARLAQVKK
jgi:phospholipid transport system substrate-binding protein